MHFTDLIVYLCNQLTNVMKDSIILHGNVIIVKCNSSYPYLMQLMSSIYISQRAHDVGTTSHQRRCNVVDATIPKRHVPAGICRKFIAHAVVSGF